MRWNCTCADVGILTVLITIVVVAKVMGESWIELTAPIMLLVGILVAQRRP